MKHRGSKFCKECGARAGAAHKARCPLLRTYLAEEELQRQRELVNPYPKIAYGGPIYFHAGREVAYKLFQDTGHLWSYHWREMRKANNSFGSLVIDRLGLHRYRSKKVSVAIAERHYIPGARKDPTLMKSSAEDKWPWESMVRRAKDRENLPRRFQVSGHARWGLWAEGPFTPVQLDTCKPPVMGQCSVCQNEFAPFFFIQNPEEATCLLQEDWCYQDENKNNHWNWVGFGYQSSESFLFSTPNTKRQWINHAQNFGICTNKACQYIADWMNGNPRTIAEHTNELIKLKRPSKRTLQSIPEEYRSAFVAARYLEFEARYQGKNNWAQVLQPNDEANNACK